MQRTSLLCAWCALVAATLAPGGVREGAAAPGAEARAISFAEAMQRAQAAPALEAAGAAARRWRGEAAGTSSWRPDWTLSAAPGHDEDGRTRWQAELHASLVPGRDGAARAAALAGAAALESATAKERRERAKRLAAAWMGAWSAQQRLALARQEEEAAAELLALAHRARALGAATVVEEAAAEAYLAEAEMARLWVEGEVTEGGLRLAEAMGDEDGPAATRGEPPSLELDGAASAPAAEEARALAGEAERRAAEHAAAARPGLQLGLRAESDGQLRAGFLVLGLTVPAGSTSRLARSAARAEKERQLGRAEELARAARLEQARARHEVEHAGELRRAAAARAAALHRQVTATTAAQRAGEALLSELVLARRGLAAARADEIKAQAMEAQARVERALAAGWKGPQS